MADHAQIRLATPRCAAAGELNAGQRLRCLRPGDSEEAVAFLEGPIPTSWQRVKSCRSGSYVRRAGGCGECPVRLLPAGATALEVVIAEGQVRLDLSFAEDGLLPETYHILRRAGEGPMVRRTTSRPEIPGTLIDLSELTPRQRDALECATRLGYFEPGSGVGVDAVAAAMGCARSTAHEHLRHGIHRLVTAAFC